MKTMIGTFSIDDFCADYTERVDASRAARYRDVSSGVHMTRMALTDGAWAAERIGRILGVKLAIMVSYFRQYTRGLDEFTFVHSDEAVSDLSAVLSLAREVEWNGEFRTWRHKATGLESPRDMESREMLALAGLDELKWDVVEAIEMIPNRCVIYPARLFHSRWPRIWDHPWPRQVEVFFFNIKGGT